MWKPLLCLYEIKNRVSSVFKMSPKQGRRSWGGGGAAASCPLAGGGKVPFIGL